MVRQDKLLVQRQLIQYLLYFHGLDPMSFSQSESIVNSFFYNTRVRFP
jgi:hypothetical protein